MNFADAVQDRTPPRARTRQLRSRAACCVLASAAALGFFAACRSEDPPERAPTPVRVQAAETQSSGTGVRYSATTFGIFEAFPNIAGRDAHVAGGGGDIFRDKDRMNAILAYPAHVYRLDVLLNKMTAGK